MDSLGLIDDIRRQSQSQSSAGAMVTEAPARGDDRRGEGANGYDDGGGVDDAEEEATFFDLDLTLSGDQRTASERRYEQAEVEEVDFAGEAVGDGVAASSEVMALGPAARLRGILLRKLRKKKAAGNPVDGGGAASPDRRGLFLGKARADVAAARSVACVIAGEQRRAPKDAARKYSGKITTLSRGRGGRDGPKPSPPPHSRAVVVAVRRAHALIGKTRSSVAAVPPRPLRSTVDSSSQQVQEGIESAIAHCKLSLGAAATAPR
ncbi:hypothetical protein ABZP36_013948 [Zizania latifolia]